MENRHHLLAEITELENKFGRNKNSKTEVLKKHANSVQELLEILRAH